MTMIFNVVTGAVMESTMSTYLLNQPEYVKIDLDNPTACDKEAAEKAAKLNVVLKRGPILSWLDYWDHSKGLQLVVNSPIHKYLEDHHLPIPKLITKDGLEFPVKETRTASCLTTAVTETVVEQTTVEVQNLDIQVQNTELIQSTPTAVEPQAISHEQATAMEEVIPPDSNKVAVGLTPTSFEEILTALTTSGNYIDGPDGELIRVRKGALYGFNSQGKATILLPEVVDIGEKEGDVVVNSVELSTEVRDGKTTVVPRLGKRYFVSAGHPQPEVLNEDCIRLHNQVLRAAGWEGVNSPIPSRTVKRNEIQTAGFLVSLTDA